jgi:hypothetical protein
MPYQVDDPLGAGLGAAAGALQGQLQQKQVAIQNALAQQKANSEQALQAAQAGAYGALGDQRDATARWRDAQQKQIIDLLPFAEEKTRAKAVQLYAQGRYDDAHALLANAQTVTQGTIQNKNIADTTRIYKGQIPLDKAHAEYYSSLPSYNAQKIQELYASLDQQGRNEASQLTNRLQIAGGNQSTAYAIALMSQVNKANGMNEQNAVKSAIEQYKGDTALYLQRVKQDAAIRASGGAGLPGGVGQAPQFVMPPVQASPTIQVINVPNPNGGAPMQVPVVQRPHPPAAKPAAATPPAATTAPAPPQDQSFGGQVSRFFGGIFGSGKPASAAAPGGLKPRLGPPPGLPPGATFVGPGPKGGDLYQFPDGSKKEWTG